MTIKIKIGADAEGEGPGEVEIDPISISLELRKTLAGDLSITDHPDVDIVVMPKKAKIVAFSKEEFNDDVYDTQDRFFKFLAKKGVIERDTIQGGTAYGALEANIPQTQYNEVHHILLAISKFIEEEKPYYTFEKQYEKELEKQLTEPLPDESTEWDPDKYHDSEKGTRVKDPYHYYGISSIYRLEE